MQRDANELFFLDEITVGTDIYCSAWGHNGLYVRKNDENMAELVAFFGGNRLSESMLHGKMLQNGDALFFIPFDARGINYYSITQKQMGNIPLFENENKGFSGIICLDKGFYLLVPRILNDNFYILDCENRKAVIDSRYNNIINSIPLQDKLKWTDALGVCAIDKDTIAIALAETDIIAIINIKNLDYKTIKTNGFTVANIYYRNSSLWVSEWKGNSILKLDIEGHTQNKYTVQKEDENIRALYSFATCGNLLLALPCFGNSIWAFDEKTDSWVEYLDPYSLEGFERVSSGSLFFGWREEKGKLVLYPKAGAGLLVINAQAGACSLTPIKISPKSKSVLGSAIEKEETDMVDMAIKKYEFLNEDIYDLTLNKYIKYISKTK